MAHRNKGNAGKGPQRHAEGAHGAKTHQRLVEQLQAGPRIETHDDPADHRADGGHRMFEGREQHDVADLNSEKNRLEKDIDRHGHDDTELAPPKWPV